jgi:hypothetical protein
LLHHNVWSESLASTGIDRLGISHQIIPSFISCVPWTERSGLHFPKGKARSWTRRGTVSPQLVLVLWARLFRVTNHSISAVSKPDVVFLSTLFGSWNWLLSIFGSFGAGAGSGSSGSSSGVLF